MKALRFIDWIAAGLVAAALLVTFGLPLVGRIEGAYWPVVVNTEFGAHVQSGPPAHRYIWTATAVKLRDCEPLRNEQGSFVSWYLGPRNGRRVEVLADFLDKPKVRPSGILAFDALAISLEPSEVLENSHADVLHRCPILTIAGVTVWRPWKTQTRFYR